MKSSEEMISGKGNELAYSADNIKFTELTDAKLATRLAFFIAGFEEAQVVQIKDKHHIWYDPEGKTFHMFLRAHTGGIASWI